MTDSSSDKHAKEGPVHELSAIGPATVDETAATSEQNPGLKSPPDGGYWAWAASKWSCSFTGLFYLGGKSNSP